MERPALTRSTILAALATIPEPCSLAMRSPTDIRSFGLIERVDIDAAGHVQVELCLTDPGCVHFRALQRYISDTLLALAGVASVAVTQTTAVLWTPDRAAVA